MQKGEIWQYRGFGRITTLNRRAREDFMGQMTFESRFKEGEGYVETWEGCS